MGGSLERVCRGGLLQTFAGHSMNDPQKSVARADRSRISGIKNGHLSYGGLLRGFFGVFLDETFYGVAEGD